MDTKDIEIDEVTLDSAEEDDICVIVNRDSNKHDDTESSPNTHDDKNSSEERKDEEEYKRMKPQRNTHTQCLVVGGYTYSFYV